MAKKKVLIITTNLFEDSELLEPKRAIEEAGHHVDVVAPVERALVGKKGARVEVDINLEDLDADVDGKYEMLLIPGGKAPAALRDNRKVQEIVRTFDDQGKPIAAICHGPQILISAGIMKGRTATAYGTVQPELVEAGVDTRDDEVVVDRNLITSRHPGDLPLFNQKILERL